MHATLLKSASASPRVLPEDVFDALLERVNETPIESIVRAAESGRTVALRRLLRYVQPLHATRSVISFVLEELADEKKIYQDQLTPKESEEEIPLDSSVLLLQSWTSVEWF